MNKKILRGLGIAAAAICIAAAVGCAKAASSSSSEAPDDGTDGTGSDNSVSEMVFTENKIGNFDGVGYELWKDTGDTVFTVKEGGTFSCEWSNINNALFRRGQKFDCTKTYREMENMTIDYGVDYQPDGNSYMCVYGWTKDPLIEFYIVQSWGSWRPPGAPMSLGKAVIGGETYDIYKTTRYNQPSIEGTKTFEQFWSVRDVKPDADGTKIEGTIPISKHFDAWAECGLELGKMYEVALTIEGYQSSGKADVFRNDLRIEGEYSKADDISVTVNEFALKSGNAPAVPVESGLFSCDFETDEQGWIPRGSSVVAVTSDAAAEGGHSLFVSGRTDKWNGAAIMLSPKVFKPGNTYSFGVKAMQNSGSDAQLKLTMQYSKDGEHYDQVAFSRTKSGEWVSLENAAYTIPDGAENLVLYVESPDSLTDFYIDSAYADGEAPAEDTDEDEEEFEFHDPIPVVNNADISWIDLSKPMVAISFDDGASALKKGDPAYRIIDTIADNGFHATFFYVSDWIKTEEQVKYAYEKGMEIANHTKTHPYLSKKTPAEIRSEFDTAHERLKEIIGAEPSKLLRLPYLDRSKTVTDTLYDVGLITCSVDTKDWNKASKEDIVEKIKKAKENGSLENAIVLCHENYATTADAMEEIIPWLKEEGWQVVTVSELFAARDIGIMGGTVYDKVP